MYKYFFLLLALLPSCVFGQNYKVVNGHHIQQLVIPQRTVQFDQRYFLGEHGYYAVEGKLRKEKSDEKDDQIRNLENEVIANKAKLDALLELFRGGGTVKPPTGGIPLPVDPVPVPPKPEEPPVEDGYDAQVLKIFGTKCARCHGDSKADAGFRSVVNGKLLHNGETVEDYRTRNKIFDLVYGANLKERGLSQMPKGSSLTDEEVELIRLWVVDRVYK